MTTKLLTIFTRTPLHVGAGASVGAVDQPIIRERHTRFPVIPGSSLKGVLADLWLEKGEDGKPRRSKEGKALFGYDEKQTKENPGFAGSLLVGESKLLAFPVRSARGCFAWITCPTALRRFARDTGRNLPVPAFSVGQENRVYPAKGLLLGGNSVVLEEYPLSLLGPLDQGIVKAFSDLAAENEVWAELASKLAVVSDELFQYFVENDCEIAQHNCIDDETGVVKGGALFSQENVPSEAMFYCVLNTKDYIAKDSKNNLSAEEAMKLLGEKLKAEKFLLQIGADITTGLGWCSVNLQDLAPRQ